jgi:hypothetical protein
VKRLSIATRKAGLTVACPKCGQHVIVPTPNDALSPKTEFLLSPEAAPPEVVPPEQIEVPYELTQPNSTQEGHKLREERDEVPILRRRKRKSGAGPILAIGLLGIAAAVMVVVAIGRHSRMKSGTAAVSTPTEQRSGSADPTRQVQYAARRSSLMKSTEPTEITAPSVKAQPSNSAGGDTADAINTLKGVLCTGVSSAAIIVVVVAYLGLTSACPRCGRWFVARKVRTTVVEQIRCYGLVTRRAVSFGSGTTTGGGTSASHSSSSSMTSWQERVPVIRTTYCHHHRCKKCRGTWTKTEVVEEEDFSRP